MQYEIHQRGYIPGKRWADGSGEYQPTLSIHYYRLTFAALADPLMDDLTERYAAQYSKSEALVKREPVIEGLDRVVAYTDTERQLLFARVGNQVIHLHYSGERNLAAHADSLAAILAKLSE